MTPQAWNDLMLVAGMAIVTFAVRYPVLALFGRIPLNPRVFAALRFVPPAVLTAIIAPVVFLPDGETLHIGIDNSYLVAAAVAVVVSWRTKNLLWTILAGMAALWVWRWVLGA